MFKSGRKVYQIKRKNFKIYHLKRNKKNFFRLLLLKNIIYLKTGVQE